MYKNNYKDDIIKKNTNKEQRSYKMNEVDNLNLRYNFFYIENLKIVVRVNSLQKFAIIIHTKKLV